MIFEPSSLIFLGILAIGAFSGSLAFLPRLLPFNNKSSFIASAILGGAIVCVCLIGLHGNFEKASHHTFAEVDSETLLREFIFAEAKGQRSAAELETISGVYSRAFDLTLNGLARETGWVVVPKGAAIIGTGRLIDATEIVKQRLEATLEAVGYVYVPAELPPETKNKTAPIADEGAKNE